MKLHIPNLYSIIELFQFRKTEGVDFDIIKGEDLPKIDSIDRVKHKGGAISPGSIGNVERPWYMHPFQDDNLLVLDGIRYVDIYTPEHGKVEHFEVSTNYVKRNGEIIFKGAAFLVWPRNVFHRIRSEDSGSISINLATHYDGFDIKSNFNIFDLDTKTAKNKVIRAGWEDQNE